MVPLDKVVVAFEILRRLPVHKARKGRIDDIGHNYLMIFEGT